MNFVSLKRFILVMFAFLLSACAGMTTVESKSSNSTAYKLNSIQVRWADSTSLPIQITKIYEESKWREAPVIDASDRTSARNAVAETITLFRESASQSIGKLLTPANVRDDAEIVLALSAVNASYECHSFGPASPCGYGSVMKFELKAALLNDKSKSELWSARISTKLDPAKNKREPRRMMPFPEQIRKNFEAERSNYAVLMDQCLAKLIDTLKDDGWFATK